MENENEFQDSQPDEVHDDQQQEESQDTDVSALTEKNKQLFERAKKAELELKQFKSKPLPEKREEGAEDIKKDVEYLKLSERKRQYGYEHGLSPQETDAVFKLNANPTKETLDDPFVKGGLQAIRSQQKVADNTPSPSNRSSIKIPTPVEYAKMTLQEKQAEFEKRQQARLNV